MGIGGLGIRDWNEPYICRMKQLDYDLVIIGGGPAGAACAISLADSGISVALVDKAVFPRDKICGDGLGVDVINQLSRMQPKLYEEFMEISNKMASPGAKIYSPSHDALAIPLVHKNAEATGYVCPRFNFDNLLFQHAKKYSNIHCREGFEISSIQMKEDRVLVCSGDKTLSCRVIIGADGAHSIVSKLLSDIKVERKHYYAGIRRYYENVTGFEENNLIELHFLDGLIPGYFWIFPLANNRANVGIGVLSDQVAKKKMNLKTELTNIISNYPGIRERFKDARPLETVKGYGLPVGSKKRKISGNRYLLAGDAACLIDPLSGEGIANAIRSGRLAAAHVKKCMEANDFSDKFNKQYDAAIYAVMWKEFRISMLLQRLTKQKWLINLIIRKAGSVGHIKQLLIHALANVEERKKLFTMPSFYWGLLTGKGKGNKQP